MLKLGAEWQFETHRGVDLACSRHGIRTTATLTTMAPGLGDVARMVDVKAGPDVLSLVLGNCC